jgi:hypothetical protein
MNEETNSFFWIGWARDLDHAIELANKKREEWIAKLPKKDEQA